MAKRISPAMTGKTAARPHKAHHTKKRPLVLKLDVNPPEEDFDGMEDDSGGVRRTPGKTVNGDLKGLTAADTMKAYMRDIGQISLVTREEEVELAARIHGDDRMKSESAMDVLIQANLRLVVKIAHDFKDRGLPISDLISEGNIGLMRAAGKFEPAKGAKFSSYAAWWIKQSMRRALASQSQTIRVPIQALDKIRKVTAASLTLSGKLGRAPTDAEIGRELDFSERCVASLKRGSPKTCSIHDPIRPGEDGELQDVIPDRNSRTPDRIAGDADSLERLLSVMDALTERERMVIKLRFGLEGCQPMRLDDVGNLIGKTRERVRQIQCEAIGKLRSKLGDDAGFSPD